jgi:thiol-disulfide isomerase/thioredoxin
MEAPLILERDHNSITVAWIGDDSVPSKVYELEICEEGTWRSLSATISNTTIRKKNLKQGAQYEFRVRSQVKGTTVWSNFSNPSEPLKVLPDNIKMLDPPTLATRDSQSLTIQWIDGVSRDGYTLRFRTDSDLSWQIISSVIRDKIVKKKSLQTGKNYYFSVCPFGCNDEYAYSSSSLPFTLPTLSPDLAKMLPLSLHTSQWRAKVLTSDALAGKTIAIYFSAHWCGPCRSFTPKLSAVYKQSKAANKNFEVIFCSADHDESEFESYYKEMPFLAIPYNDDKREAITGIFKVSGIPRLVVLAPSGRIIVTNAAGQSITIETIEGWIQQGSKM